MTVHVGFEYSKTCLNPLWDLHIKSFKTSGHLWQSPVIIVTSLDIFGKYD